MGSIDSDTKASESIAILEARARELEATEARLLPVVQHYTACSQALHHVRMSLTRLRNPNSPISKVPGEILALIFDAVPRSARHGVLIRTLPRVNHVPFSVVISHVSRLWRYIAIHTPSLWTTIRFSKLNWRSLSLHRLFVERSRSRLLDIHFTCYDGMGAFHPSVLHLHRCRKLVIASHEFPVVFHILQHLRTLSAPRLESFKINMLAGELEEPLDQIGRIFEGGAPFLSSVKLCGISSLGCRPPLAAITYLQLHGRFSAYPVTLETFSEVLNIVASSLRHLSLEGMVVSYQEEDVIFDIHLPVLSFLDIRFPDDFDEYNDEDEDEEQYIYGYIQSLWKTLKVPALETLSLYYLSAGQLHRCMVDLMQPMHAETRATLQSLYLDQVEVGDHIDFVASACPNIVKLSLIDVTDADIVMKFILDITNGPLAFNRYGQRSRRWRSLQRLTITSCNKLLRDVVLARKAAGYPIKELCLDRRVAPHKIDWFRRQVEVVTTRHFII